MQVHSEKSRNSHKIFLFKYLSWSTSLPLNNLGYRNGSKDMFTEGVFLSELKSFLVVLGVWVHFLKKKSCPLVNIQVVLPPIILLTY